METVLVDLGNQVTAISGDAGVLLGNFLVFIVLVAVLFFLAQRQGASGLISLNIALYVGYGIYTVFPYKDAVIGIGDTAVIQATISVILFAIATLLPFIVAIRLTNNSFGSLSLIHDTILSVLAAGFLMALAYHVFDISNIYHFSEPLNLLFAPEGYFFYWFVAPLVGLYFLAR